MLDKYVSRQIRVQIRHVLLDVWDPIGVKDEPYAQDEYDGYIGELYELLLSRAPDEALVDYLCWATNDRMGLARTKSDMTSTVAALRKIEFPADSN